MSIRTILRRWGGKISPNRPFDPKFPRTQMNQSFKYQKFCTRKFFSKIQKKLLFFQSTPSQHVHKSKGPGKSILNSMYTLRSSRVIRFSSSVNFVGDMLKSMILSTFFNSFLGPWHKHAFCLTLFNSICEGSLSFIHQDRKGKEENKK